MLLRYSYLKVFNDIELVLVLSLSSSQFSISFLRGTL